MPSTGAYVKLLEEADFEPTNSDCETTNLPMESPLPHYRLITTNQSPKMKSDIMMF